MSNEERSAEREHRSVLAGMTRKEAEALVARMDPIDHPEIKEDPDEGFGGAAAVTVLCESPDDIKGLLALAALGARCVGATEFKSSEGESLLVHLVGRDGKARDTFAYLPPRRVLVLEVE